MARAAHFTGRPEELQQFRGGQHFRGDEVRTKKTSRKRGAGLRGGKTFQEEKQVTKGEHRA